MPGPSALWCPTGRADDAAVSADALVFIGWAILFAVLVGAAMVIGQITARFLLRATESRADKR